VKIIKHHPLFLSTLLLCTSLSASANSPTAENPAAESPSGENQVIHRTHFTANAPRIDVQRTVKFGNKVGRHCDYTLTTDIGSDWVGDDLTIELKGSEVLNFLGTTEYTCMQMVYKTMTGSVLATDSFDLISDGTSCTGTFPPETSVRVK